MKHKFISILSLAFTVFIFSADSFAKTPKNIETVVRTNFPPAMENQSLEKAQIPFKMEAVRSFVVLKRGGIPAERPRFFIEWQKYDYRGAVIHLDKNDKLTTRRGRPYTYLHRGTVLAVAGIKFFNRTAYLKLITPEVYLPESMEEAKRHARVTVMLGFKFSKSVFKEDDSKAVLNGMEKWLKPFMDLDAAKAYSAKMLESDAEAMMIEEAEIKVEEEAKVKAKQQNASRVDEVVADPDSVKAAENEAKMDALEDKIEAAKEQMKEAEKEMQKLEKDMKKGKK